MEIEEMEPGLAPPTSPKRRPHPLEVPDLDLCGTFYPLGFPAEVRTNSSEILAQADELWGRFEPRFETEPIKVDVHIIGDASESIECPPATECQIMLPLLISVADGRHYSLANLAEGRTQLVLSKASEKHKNYLAYFFLGAAALGQIASRFALPVHAACVEWNGRGVLLCGESGAGKSTLSYACARAGWKYITDDATYLLHDPAVFGSKRIVTGNYNQVRFRPSAARLFPEIEGLPITPRAVGKPSIELPTFPNLGIECVQATAVDYLVFLNREYPSQRSLRTYSREKARQFLRQVLFGTPEAFDTQYWSIERSLAAEIFELRYSDLDWAVERLSRLVEEGR